MYSWKYGNIYLDFVAHQWLQDHVTCPVWHVVLNSSYLDYWTYFSWWIGKSSPSILPIFCRLFKCFFPTDLSKKGVNTADSNPKRKKIQRHNLGKIQWRNTLVTRYLHHKEIHQEKCWFRKQAMALKIWTPRKIAFKNLNPPKRKTIVWFTVGLFKKTNTFPPQQKQKDGRLSFLFVVASWQVRSVSFRKCFDILMACQNNKRYKRLSHHPVPRLVSQSFPLLPGGGIPGVCVYRV